MSKYTAQEIRSAVQRSICEDNIAEMLLQYADELEREKRYEYGIKWLYHMGLIADVSDSFETVCERVGSENNENGLTVCHLVRREVGEWEEVSNED